MRLRTIIIPLLLLTVSLTLFGTSLNFSVREYSIDGKKYISLYDIATKTGINQTFDVISQRGKLYHKHHFAVFQSGYAAYVIDGRIYMSSYPVMRKNGEVFIPSLFFKEMSAAFFPEFNLKLSRNHYSLNKKSTPADDPVANLVPVSPAKEKIAFIIIDPGHGGKDPGAIGHKVREKDLTLTISKKVKKYLEKNLRGVEVIMTREKDIFIELGKRTEIANRKLKKGTNGLFISMHVNASISSRSNGFENYYLSQNATNEESRATAALENNVVVLESNKHKPYQDVEYIEALMLTTQIQKESALLAGKIQNRMKKNLKETKSRGVKKADFFVLRGALMPAVLVEAGYITNKKERGLLIKGKFQDRVAKSVGDGIKDFITEYNK
ncbi:MAG: N-acetylmuramoyl-L-alanine amidase [Spirochaetes bacterium]|jgi:N-acetylmuramoyl-L-alanine amidase|nr:N-acetylmuramoyl-L-alanine amidase [Spirochaetota bacterium]